MNYTDAVFFKRERSDALRRRIIGLYPAVAAIAYPFLLQAFHAAVSSSGGALSAVRIAAAAVLLALAFALPLSGLAFAYWWTRDVQPSQSDIRARTLSAGHPGAAGGRAGLRLGLDAGAARSACPTRAKGPRASPGR